jgi:rhomboid protease GluP
MGIWVVPGIDNSAHAGGFVVGGLLARVLAKPWTPLSPRGRSGAGLALAVLVAGVGRLTLHIPPPRYLLHDELKVQQAIQNFTLADQRISQQWNEILSTAPAQRLSFEQLAGRIESTVTAGYEQTFEQLVAATPGSQAPSAAALGTVQAYASKRVQVSRDLVAGLRSNDPQMIRNALRQARGQHAAASTSRAASAAASVAR